MAESNFVVKNGLVVNTSFTANSTVLQANGLTVNSSSANVTGTVSAANLTTTTNVATFGTTVYSVSNGNVGIGTSTPGTKLSISAPGNTHILQIGGNTNGNLPGPLFGGTFSYNYLAGNRDFGFWNTDTTPPATSFGFYQLTGASTYSNLMFITSGGNVGIGTTASVNARLAVSGTANISGNTAIAGSLSSANLTTTTNVATFGTSVYSISSDNLGIGTATPDARLAVSGTTIS